MGGVSSKTTNEETFEKIQQNPFQMIKLKQEEEKLKLLAVETEAKSKVLAEEAEQAKERTKLLAEEAEQAKERTKLLAAEVSKAQAIAKQEEEKIPQIAEESKVKLQQINQEIINSKAESEAKRKAIQPSYVLLGLAGLGVAVLAGDYIWYNSARLIRSRIKATISNGSLPLKLKSQPPVYFLSGQEKLQPIFKPTLLLGPTGCGKSTLLSQIARDHLSTKIASPSVPSREGTNDDRKRTPAPLVFITIRDSASDKSEAKDANQSDGIVTSSNSNVSNRMNDVTAQVFEQIGFPTREPLINSISSIIFSIYHGSESLDVKVHFEKRTVNRFIFALNCLFRTCAEIREDRFRTKQYSREDAALILLLDEVHDLVKDNRLAAYGGREVFTALMKLLVIYGINSDKVRTVIAGSSGQVIFDVEDSLPGSRYDTYYLKDPAESDVTNALKKNGYTDAECSKIFNLCGTRLRLLEKPLAQKIIVEDFLQGTKDIVELRFRKFFAEIKTIEDKDTMIQIFDAIVEAKTPKYLNHIPASVRKLDINKLLFINLNSSLTFQSQVVRTIWLMIRKDFLSIKEFK